MLVCETRNPFIPTSATIINVPPDPGPRETPTPVKRNKTDSRISSSKYPKTKIRRKRKRAGVKISIPSSLSTYYRNAPIKKLSHPLEENIFSSLLITLVAVAVALILGTPFLFCVGLLFLFAVGIRYFIAILHGLASYTRYICSNRQHPSSRPPQIIPRDRMAFANDVRWLGAKKRSRCQSILHTLLVFEGSIDLSSFQHLIQTRVLRAETPEGELLYPRLLQRLVSVGSGYLWELDLTFDIRNHIFSGPTQLKSEGQLQEYLGRLLTHELPTSRPLWEIRLVPSHYGGGKDTMAVLRVHQCLADGVSLIRILCHALADHQQMHIPQRPHFAGLSFGFNVIRTLIVGPVTLFLWWFGTFRDRTLFSIPLPKIRRGKGRIWPFGGVCTSSIPDVNVKMSEEDDDGRETEEEEMITFTSSIGSSSSCSSDESSVRSGSSSSSAKRNSTQQASSSPSGGDNPGALPPPPPPEKMEKRVGFFGRSAKNYKKRCRRRKKLGRRQRRRRQTHSKNRKLGRRWKRRKSVSLSNSSGSLSSGYSRGTFSSSGSLSRSRRQPSWNVVWSAPISLPKVARIKQIMRSSYNDVLLSAVAGSVRIYLQDQGIPYPGDMQVVIPIDLRNDVASPKVSPRLGCKVASVVTTIPSGMESAIPRLWATRHRLDELKSSADSVVAYGATTILLNVLPHRVAIPILDSILNKASFQFSNLPGPTFTTVIGGYPLKGIYPIYPPPGALRASISVFTYADQVHITVVSHKSLVNAGPKLLRGMTEEVDQLSRQLSQRRVPGESRRSMRHFSQTNNSEITKPPTRQIQLQLQVVQKELAQLNSRLEAEGIILSEEDFLPIPASPVPSSSSGAYGKNGGGGGGMVSYCLHHHHHHHLHPDQSTDELPSTSSSELSGAVGQAEIQQRLKSLKNEFAELLGELRRRSSIVDGIAMSFEDEENQEEYRKPRKRALSVVSMTRRSSIFSSRSNNAPDSPAYSSDEEMPSSPDFGHHLHQPQQQHSTGSSGTGSGGNGGAYPPTMRHASSPMRTTAV